MASITATTSNSEDETIASSFLRDAIPKEVLSNVLKYFSRLPKAKNWETHIPLEEITHLYGVQGLECFLNTRFRTLCVSSSIDCSIESKHFKWKLKREAMLWTDDIESAFHFLKKTGGESFENLVIGYGYATYREDEAKDAVSALRQLCPNIVWFSVHDPHQNWLSGFDKHLERLERLEIATETPYDIAKHCHGLRELTLHANCHTVGDSEFWRIVGTTLECLDLTFYSAEVEEISEIKTHCRNLRRIFIHGLESFNAEISDLLSSYGDQLKYCHVENMNESELKHITERCVNASFSVSVDEDGGLIPTLSTLGYRLNRLRVNFRGCYYGEWLDISNAWIGCTNLRELTLIDCEVGDVSAYMAALKPSLNILNVRLADSHDGNLVKSVMGYFSDGANCVEEFIFSGSEFPQGACDKFAEANKSSLFSVSISVPYFRPEHLEPFIKLPNLREIHHELGYFTEEMLRPLCARGVQCLGLYRTPWYALTP